MAHDEQRDHLRYRQHMNETMSLADQRRLFHARWDKVRGVAGGVGEIRGVILRADADLCYTA